MLSEACLPATGVDNWTIMILVVVAAVLMGAGVISIKKSRGRVALAIAPLLLLGAIIAAPAAPAQAIAAKIPDTTMSTAWAVGGGNLTSLTPSAPNFALLEQASDLSQEAGNVPVYATWIYLVGDPNPYQLGVSIAGLNASNGVVTMDEDDVENGILEYWEPLPPSSGTYNVIVTITFDYEDDCGEPLQTVFTYNGVYNYVPAND